MCFCCPLGLTKPTLSAYLGSIFWTPTARSAIYYKTSVQEPKVYDSLKITRGGAGNSSSYWWGLSSGNKRRPRISLSVLISFGYKRVFVLVATEELKWGELQKPGLWTWHGWYTHSSQLLWLTRQGQASWKPQHRGWRSFRYPIPSWGASSSWRILRLQVSFLCVELATGMLLMLRWMSPQTHTYGKHLLDLVDYKNKNETLKLGDSVSTNMLERGRGKLNAKHIHTHICKYAYIHTYTYPHIYAHTYSMTKCMRFCLSLPLYNFPLEKITF